MKTVRDIKKSGISGKIHQAACCLLIFTVSIAGSVPFATPVHAEDLYEASAETFELTDEEIAETEACFAEAGESTIPDEWYKEDAEEDLILDNVMVLFKGDTSDEEISAVADEIGGSIVKDSGFLGTRLCTFDVEDSRDAAEKLLAYDIVLSAEPNIRMEPQIGFVSTGIPSNSAEQWNFDTMHVDDAWDIVENHYQAPVNVAVMDFGYPNTQIATGNLSANVLTEYAYDAADIEADYEGFDHPVTGYEAFDQTPPISGYNDSIYGNHATAVTSIIAGSSISIHGISGVGSGWNNRVVRIVPINASADTEYIIPEDVLTSDAVDALGYAVEHGCKIVNMSFGSNKHSITFETACRLVRNVHSVCLVASAGNDNSDNGDNPHYPSDYDSVISVIATDHENERIEFEGTDGNIYGSNYGGKTEEESLLISAPGIDVPHLTNDTDTPIASDDWGTSYAAPEVSGVIALMLSVNPDLTPDEVEDILAETATDIYDAGFDDESGYGIVNAEKAVRRAAGENAKDRSADPTELTEVTVSGNTPFRDKTTDLRKITITANAIDPYERLYVKYGSSEKWGSYGANTVTISMSLLNDGKNTIEVSVKKQYRKTRSGTAAQTNSGNAVTKDVYKYNLYHPQNIIVAYDGKTHNINEKIFGSDFSTSQTGLTIKYGTAAGTYNLSSASRKNVGKQTYYYRISGNSLDRDYTGSFYIQVKPPATGIAGVSTHWSYSLSTNTITDEQTTITWDKQTTQTTGYQLQYSTDSYFTDSGTTTRTISSNSQTSYTTANNELKKGALYHFRIRTFKTDSGTTYYSDWTRWRETKGSEYVKFIPFYDIPDPDSSLYDPVEWAVINGIAAGFSDGTFRPNNTCNRAAAITFLWRLAGKPGSSGTAAFSDMPDDTAANQDFRKAISWGTENGILSGFSDGTFRPWNTCNRAAAVTFIWRLAGKPEPSSTAAFSDMPADTAANQDFRKAISWASENGIATGWSSDNTFRPWNDCSRGAIITFLYRYHNLD